MGKNISHIFFLQKLNSEQPKSEPRRETLQHFMITNFRTFTTSQGRYGSLRMLLQSLDVAPGNVTPSNQDVRAGS